MRQAHVALESWLEHDVCLAYKANVTLYLERDLVAGAKQRGINLSGLVECQLKQTLANIQSLNGQGNIDQKSHNCLTIPESPPRSLSVPELLDRFEKFCLVDLQLSEITVNKRIGHVARTTRFLQTVGKRPEDLRVDDIRDYLRRSYREQNDSVQLVHIARSQKEVGSLSFVAGGKGFVPKWGHIYSSKHNRNITAL